MIRLLLYYYSSIITPLTMAAKLVNTVFHHTFSTRKLAKPLDASKIGRNEPCPCGSGAKYKKCCGK